jgi:hypothetical protein
MNLEKCFVIVHAHDLEVYGIGRISFAKQAMTLFEQTFYMEMTIRLKEMIDYEQERDEATMHASLLGQKFELFRLCCEEEEVFRDPFSHHRG